MPLPIVPPSRRPPSSHARLSARCLLCLGPWVPGGAAARRVVFVCRRVLHVDVRRTRYSRLVCARIPPLVSASAPARPRPRPCSLSHYHHRTRTAAAPSPSLYHYHPHRPIWSLIASGSLSYRPPRLSIVPPLPPAPSLPLYTIGPYSYHPPAAHHHMGHSPNDAHPKL